MITLEQIRAEKVERQRQRIAATKTEWATEGIPAYQCLPESPDQDTNAAAIQWLFENGWTFDTDRSYTRGWWYKPTATEGMTPNRRTGDSQDFTRGAWSAFRLYEAPRN
jgi:hypothetical protein